MKIFTEARQIGEAVVPIRWCITKDEATEMTTFFASHKRAHVVITVSRKVDWGWQQVDLHTVPFANLLHYISFRSPGPHRIHVKVCSKDNAKYFRKRFFKERETFVEPRTGMLGDWGTHPIGGLLTVDVPDGLFARPPHPVLAKWVNAWFDRRPRDQCAFRKRMIFAFLVQPLPMLLWWLGKSLVALFFAFGAVLFGVRGLTWRQLFGPIIAPFQYQIDYRLPHQKSIFTHDAAGNPRPLSIRLLAPYNLLTIVVVSTFIFVWVLGHLPSLLTLVLTVLLALGIILLLAGNFSRITERIYDRWLAPWFDRWTEDERKRQKEAFEEELAAAGCEVATAASLQALPEDHRTLYLRFLDLKSKVCRPYAGGGS